MQFGERVRLLREGAQLGQFCRGARLGSGRKVQQKALHRGGRLGHLGNERKFRVMGEAEQARQFMPQLQDFRHQRAVVVLAGLGPRRARRKCG